MNDLNALAMQRIREYKKELEENQHVVPALFWAGKMSMIGASLLRCDTATVSGWSILLKQVIREYDLSIERLTKLDLSNEFEKLAEKIRLENGKRVKGNNS